MDSVIKVNYLFHKHIVSLQDVPDTVLGSVDTDLSHKLRVL